MLLAALLSKPEKKPKTMLFAVLFSAAIAAGSIGFEGMQNDS